jgi:alpha-glucosidase
MKPKLLLLYCCLLFPGLVIRAADTASVKSPDGNITFRLFNKAGELHFTLHHKARAVLNASPLRLSSESGSLSQDLSFGRQEKFSKNETYPIFGAHSTAVSRCNGLKIFLNRNGKQALLIEVRVFNDGAAFRQTIFSEKDAIIPGESTVFNLPSGSSTWYHDLDMHYESVHQVKKIDSVKNGEWLAPPVTYRTPAGVYVSLTEAQLTGYSGMALKANGENGMVLTLADQQPTSYPYRLRYSAEDTLRLKNPASVKTPVLTPWRVIIVAKDLNQLVNSDIVSNLNPATDKDLFPKGLHTEWLKPGRAVWKYLNGGGDGTPEVMKHFTDGAAALGFEHNILEGFWSRWTNEQLKDVIDYSKQKGVGIWLWKHSKSLRNPASRDSFFRKCHDLGAAYKLHVDFHGANKPTGLSRTYPNELTREAVKGMESSKITDRATHETTIPFTRMVAGGAEYTVMHFGERRKNTSWAHQVASAAIINAPMLTYAANPDTILVNPAVDIIKSIPANWDETIVLPGSAIGECAVFARRKGNQWFLAVMNGNAQKKLVIRTDFLKGKYNSLIAKDGLTPDSIIIEKSGFTSAGRIELNLAPGGGYIARFSK